MFNLFQKLFKQCHPVCGKIVRLKVYMIFASPMTLTFTQQRPKLDHFLTCNLSYDN